MAAFISQGLQESGYKVFVAYDGANGLELLMQKEIDLVVLDIILPGLLDGREVARKIRRIGYSNLPIIMLTALGTTENIVQGLDSGADDYLVKPFKFKELYKDYLKQKQKINLFNDISHMKKEYSNIKNISNKIANGFVDKYKEKLTYCIELLGKANEPNNNLLYSQEYSIFKNTYEADQTYTVDTSYNSKNKYYENYFKIANGEKLHGDYNIGEYKIKNIEDLLSYIMFVIIL